MTNMTCPSTDTNFLSPNGFLFTVTKLPDVSFFVQEINLPGIVLGEPDFTNPFSKQPIPGDQITWEPLDVSFAVDKNLKNYLSISDWMIALGFPNNYEQYKSLVGDRALGQTELQSNYSDATLIILGPNNLPVKYVYFSDCFPVSLSSINMTTQSQDVQYVKANVSFKFGYYKIE